MAKLYSLLLAVCCILLGYIALSEAQGFDSRGFPKPIPAAYYQSRYYKNLKYYKDRDFFSNFYRTYNPDVPVPVARILDQENSPNEDGTYNYSYDTENGIHGEERGVPVALSDGRQTEYVEGAFSYLSPEGLKVGVRYTADQYGYHPTITYDGYDAASYYNRPASADVIVNTLA